MRYSLIQNIDKFVLEVNKYRFDVFNSQSSLFEMHMVKPVAGGRKYLKLAEYSDGTPYRVWGFIAMYDGDIEGTPHMAGDLLRANSWDRPAHGSRGNILDGTARYSEYGPIYYE